MLGPINNDNKADTKEGIQEEFESVISPVKHVSFESALEFLKGKRNENSIVALVDAIAAMETAMEEQLYFRLRDLVIATSNLVRSVDEMFLLFDEVGLYDDSFKELRSEVLSFCKGVAGASDLNRAMELEENLRSLQAKVRGVLLVVAQGIREAVNGDREEDAAQHESALIAFVERLIEDLDTVYYYEDDPDFKDINRVNNPV